MLCEGSLCLMCIRTEPSDHTLPSFHPYICTLSEKLTDTDKQTSTSGRS